MVITDLELLEQVTASFPGLKWNHDKKQFMWYAGQKKECAHAITQSVTYSQWRNHEVGVVQADPVEVDGVQTPAYNLAFDPYDQRLSDIIGANGQILLNAYSEAFAHKMAAANGFIVEKSVDKDGNTVLELIDVSQ